MMTEATFSVKTNPPPWLEGATCFIEEEFQGQKQLKWPSAWDAQHTRLAEIAHNWIATQTPSNYQYDPSASMQIFPLTKGYSATEQEIVSSPFYVLDESGSIVLFSPEGTHSFFTSEVFPAVHDSLTADIVAAPSVDPLNIGRQLEGLRDLQYGWADGMQLAGGWGKGHGKALSNDGLDWLVSQFSSRYAPDLPRPYLYPTPEGGIQAEWSLGPNEASLEIDLVTHTAQWHCLNLRISHSTEHILDLDSGDAWEWLATGLHQLATTAK